jgi:hypothetical protein
VSARLLHVTDEEYHADPCASPSLSHSLAHVLIDQSPAHAYLVHPKLGGFRRDTTPEMDHGKLIHALILEEGSSVDVIEADDWRTKAAKEARDVSRRAGRIPVLVHKYDLAKRAADNIRENLSRKGIHFNGDSEVAIEWTEPAQEGDVVCRCKIDHLILAGGIIYDVKTTSSADLKHCAQSVIDYGYDIQEAAYRRAVAEYRPDMAGALSFVFLFVETDPPYATTPAKLDGVFRELGERKWGRAVETFSRCLASDTWPDYTSGSGAVTLEAPGWIMAQAATEPAQ